MYIYIYNFGKIINLKDIKQIKTFQNGVNFI
jgi:hypothetical protein